MNGKNVNLRNFLIGGAGYTVGAISGVLLISLFSKLGVAGWLLSLIDQNQVFLKLLGVLLTVGLLLALGGALIGGLGGLSLAYIMKTAQRTRLILGSAIAFAISSPLIVMFFLLLISFIGLYNNFTRERVEHFGIIFGIFGLVFGLLVGVLQALMCVKLRHSWRVILSALLGFTFGGIILGLLVRLVNPTVAYKTYPILTEFTLLVGLLAPFFLGGGAMGFVYGHLAVRMEREQKPEQFIFPAKWQTIVVAIVGILFSISLIRALDTISTFLTINAGKLSSELLPVTVGVQWTPAESYSRNLDSIAIPQDGQESIVIYGADQIEHQAWCGSDGRIHYQKGKGTPDVIDFPGCTNIPALALDNKGQPHIVWYSQEILDNNGVSRSDNLLVESIRTMNGWSDAAIVTRMEGPVTPTMTTDSQGNLILAWVGADQEMMVSVQESYECDPADLSYLELASVKAVLAKNLRPDTADYPFCRNLYKRIEYTPNPEPEYSDLIPTQDGAFDYLAAMADTAQYEVLFTTMQYEPNYAPPSPGSVLAKGVANLYQKVKNNPEDYPRGLTVKILLGNYPELSTFTYGDQIYAVISDLRDAGVESMVDPEIGWKLEVANFPGTYPHSHTKFVVVDGKKVLGVGYNFGYLHLPVDHPSGQGFDMLDLGLQLIGPVAQDAISAFDDLWSGADQIYCENFHPTDGSDWEDTCQEVVAISDHVPEVLRTYLPPDGKDHAFSIYRTKDYKEADTFIATSLNSAQDSIDMIHVNFSLEMICMANLIFPDVCTIKNSLPWMDAVIAAVSENGVKVRAIVETSNSNGLENRVAANVLFNELERRGLRDHVELRFYNGKVHAKSTLIDSRMLIIGSQNMHYSSWSESGLAEYSLVTDAPDAIQEYQALFETKWQQAIPFDGAGFSLSP